MESIVFFLLIVGFLTLFLFVFFIPIPLWIATMRAGVAVSLLSFVGMRLRRVPAGAIVRPLITAGRAGIELNVNELERHYLAGGNVTDVVDAIVSARKANIDLTFERAAAIDLEGRDMMEAVSRMANESTTEDQSTSSEDREN